MDITFTEEDQSFRADARDWLSRNVPKERPPDDGQALREFDLAWQATQYEGGWAGISWPIEYGGRGLSLLQQMIWHEEYARAGAPNVGTSFVGLNDAGPTLMIHGSEDQKVRHLSRILEGRSIWAQGYSEPNAGSDLASLQTRGTIDGNEMVITGEKIWTSYADIADHQELLVRTDPDAPKHKGITWIICDLSPSPPGLTVEPIRMLSGIDRLCRVIYDEVRIPLSNVVGQVNDGWNVVSSSLYLKRGTGRIADQVSLARTVDDLVELAVNTRGPHGRARAFDNDELARRLATARAEVIALRAMTYAELSRVERDGHPGAEGSFGRIFHALLSQRVHRLALDILGPRSLDIDGASDDHYWTKEYLWSFTETVGGGTSEIQSSVIAERVLGLPHDR
jgi:alkylation response protein AidB-like acyl-CoA dehydrogenase